VSAPWLEVLPGARRFFAASFMTQLAMLGLFGFAGWLISSRLASQERSISAQQHESEALRMKVEGLAADTQGLKSEMVNLRQSVSSHTGEDVLFLKVLLLKPDIDVGLAHKIADETHRNAQLYGRDPNLVLAIMAVESDFNPKAVSPVGAQGLMQVMPHWKRVLGISSDLFDVDTNIHHGMQILGFYLEMYGDLETALTAYNRGPGPVDFALQKGKDARNGYAAKVLATYDRMKSLDSRPTVAQRAAMR